MLSRALPTNVVLVIGEYACAQAAVLVQKWVRGAVVRVDHWGHGACLCDMDWNLVYLEYVYVEAVCNFSIRSLTGRLIYSIWG